MRTGANFFEVDPVSLTKEMVNSYFKIFEPDTVKKMDSDKLLESLSNHFTKYRILPIALTAKKIVAATIKFTQQTDPGSEFVEMRKNHFKDEDLIKRLNNNGDELTKLVSEAKKSERSTPDVQRLIDDVVDRCVDIIKGRMTVLKNSKDRIYPFYLQENNLRKFIDDYKPAPTLKR